MCQLTIPLIQFRSGMTWLFLGDFTETLVIFAPIPNIWKRYITDMLASRLILESIQVPGIPSE